MTPTLLDMARKAGFTVCREESTLGEMLESFAKLIIEHEAAKWYPYGSLDDVTRDFKAEVEASNKMHAELLGLKVAAQQALEVLDWLLKEDPWAKPDVIGVRNAIRRGLEQPIDLPPDFINALKFDVAIRDTANEPVAWATAVGSHAHVSWGKDRPDYPTRYEVPLYTCHQSAKEKASQSANCEAPGGINSDHARSADYMAAEKQEPVLCINPKVIDPATGKVRNGTGALTYSDTPCAGWSMPLYAIPPAAPVQEPVIDHSCKDTYELIMKWADIYAAQTGELYSQAAQDPSKAARMADERTMLACVVAQAFPSPAAQRQWVGLTDEQIEELFQGAAGADEEVVHRFARAIEAKLREKNAA